MQRFQVRKSATTERNALEGAHNKIHPHLFLHLHLYTHQPTHPRPITHLLDNLSNNAPAHLDPFQVCVDEPTVLVPLRVPARDTRLKDPLRCRRKSRVSSQTCACELSPRAPGWLRPPLLGPWRSTCFNFALRTIKVKDSPS